MSNMKRKLSLLDKIWPFAEPITALIAGLISLLPPFNRPDVAIIVWAVGGLYTISSVSIRKQIVSELQNVFDEEFKDVQKVSRILNLYSEIQDPDLTQLKKESLIRCLTELENLNRGFAPDVRGTSFYVWFIDQFNKAEKSINSVSSMPETNWIEYELERKSLNANYRAAKRGCVAKRIFIIQDEKLLLRKEARQVFFEHLENKVLPLVTTQSQINDPSLWEIVKSGFVIIDDRVLLVDSAAPPITAGRMSKIPSEISQYRKAFDQLELSSIQATVHLQTFISNEINRIEVQYGDINKMRSNLSGTCNEEHDDLSEVIKIWEDLNTDLQLIKKFGIEQNIGVNQKKRTLFR